MISALQNQSNYQDSRIRAHGVDIELLQTLEKQSSEYTGTMLGMISAMRIDNPERRSRFTNESKLKSETLSESDTKSIESEMPANRSIGGMEACKNQISVLAERMDGIKGHFENRYGLCGCLLQLGIIVNSRQIMFSSYQDTHNAQCVVYSGLDVAYEK